MFNFDKKFKLSLRCSNIEEGSFETQNQPDSKIKTVVFYNIMFQSYFQKSLTAPSCT